jgi:general secretion pathway protein K
MAPTSSRLARLASTPRAGSDAARRPSRPGERGAALLVVMVAVAVLTALAVDLAYDTRVSLRIAGNARNDLQASYLARSGVSLSRLVLSFQQELDDSMKVGTQAFGQLAMPRPQIWRIVPVGSDLAKALFEGSRATPVIPVEGAGAQTSPGSSPEGAAAGRGGPAPGTFAADVDDEGRKVNFQLEALGTNPLLAAQVQAVFQLVCDPRWDALFDRDDENGIRVSRQDLLVYLRDWVDDDEQGSALAASFPPGGCAMISPLNPFAEGFQDENYAYDRGQERYRAKNARMDSLDELHLVAGVTDAFMAAFEDAITVYLPRDEKRNVNVGDRRSLLELAKVMADPPNQPMLQDPQLPERLEQLVQQQTLGGMLSITPMQMGQIVTAGGVTVNQNLLGPNGPFTDRASVFRIRSAGRAGDVTKTVDAVIRFKTQAAPSGQQASATLGQLVHWREE